MVLEELEALRKKEKGLHYRKVYKPQLQEIAAKAEARKLADWKVNFPWKPTHDTANKFIPKRHLSDLRNAQGYLFDSIEQFWEHYNDYNAPDKEDIHAGDYHMRLKKFFEDEVRFSRQFQQIYEILNGNGRGHNPALLVAVFRELRRYKHALTIPEDVQKTFRGRTREEHIDGYYTNIYAVLTDKSWFNLEFLTEEGKEKAKPIRDRLVNEVQGVEELPRDVMDYGSSHGMSSGNEYGRDLLSGEKEILVPYECWYEEAQGFYDNQHYHFRWSIEEDDPSLKALMPKLFPSVKIKDGVLVEKDSDPVKDFPDANYRIINHKHENFLMPINEDGTIRLPTLEEIEQMRAAGQVREDLSPILSGAVDRGIGLPSAKLAPNHPVENNPSEED